MKSPTVAAPRCGERQHSRRVMAAARIGARTKSADGAAVEVGDLVGTDHPSLRELSSPGLRLGAREAHGGVAWQLAGQRSLVHAGLAGLEGKTQALQQLPAIA